jgi:cystathionine beta-lyase/cystathionine gamma-synthase
VYGGTFRLFSQVLNRYELSFTYVDTGDLDAVERAFTPATRMLFVETPSNPVMRLTDLRLAADLAHKHDARLVVDNTFASPYIQRPLELGADLVTHSTTKYLNGHSDSVGGVVIAMRDDDIAWLAFVQNAAGAILGPFDAWLVLRGTKTLPLRMIQHSANGLALAEFLAAHQKVRHVHYPGLPAHPQHDLARRQMRGFGGMLAFELGSLEAARRLLNSVRLMALAESLGGVETLISHPATMTHASVPAAHRQALGITDGLVRISAGIEDIEDLKEDLAQALENA